MHTIGKRVGMLLSTSPIQVEAGLEIQPTLLAPGIIIASRPHVPKIAACSRYVEQQARQCQCNPPPCLARLREEV